MIRNFLLRITGLKVGDWDDMVDSERVRKDLVDLFQMALQSNSLQPKMVWRGSQRRLAGSQGLTHPTGTFTAEAQTSSIEDRAMSNPATGNYHEETVAVIDLTADDCDDDDDKKVSYRR